MKENNKSKGKDLSIPTGSKQIETCHLGNPHKAYEIDSRDESSYIHEHLTTLNFIVSEFGIKNILEIGTGPGESLLAMVENTEAHVTTVDVEQCSIAKDKIMFGDFSHQVTFVRGKSDKLGLFGTWDLVLIDGGHSAKQVWNDIMQFAWQVPDNGFLIFHDTTNPAWPGVSESINKFLEKDHTWNRYQWFNCNGLLVLRRELND
jgi:predicted O-methyltransferase YrrM